MGWYICSILFCKYIAWVNNQDSIHPPAEQRFSTADVGYNNSVKLHIIAHLSLVLLFFPFCPVSFGFLVSYIVKCHGQ